MRSSSGTSISSGGRRTRKRRSRLSLLAPLGIGEVGLALFGHGLLALLRSAADGRFGPRHDVVAPTFALLVARPHSRSGTRYHENELEMSK